MTLPDAYASLKQGLSAATGASEDLLHVHFGLLIFVAAALLLRRRMHSNWPVGLVWAFALANEAVDYFATGYALDTSLLDVLNTVVWPTVLHLVARRRRVSPPLGG
jgi:hypothetical protein